MEAKMVLPGDEIAVAEEFEPGEGTYERNGLVFAATPGVLVLDPENRVARGRGLNPPAESKAGDIVSEAIADIRGRRRTARATGRNAGTRRIGEERGGTFPIWNVSEGNTK